MSYTDFFPSWIINCVLRFSWVVCHTLHHHKVNIPDKKLLWQQFLAELTSYDNVKPCDYAKVKKPVLSSVETQIPRTSKSHCEENDLLDKVEKIKWKIEEYKTELKKDDDKSKIKCFSYGKLGYIYKDCCKRLCKRGGKLESKSSKDDKSGKASQN